MAGKQGTTSKEKAPAAKAAAAAAAAAAAPTVPPAALVGDAAALAVIEQATAVTAPAIIEQESATLAPPAAAMGDAAALAVIEPDAAAVDALDAGEVDPVLILGAGAAPLFLQALREVGLERLRQVEVEGCTPARDDELTDYQLPRAAASYASNASGIPRHKALLYWPFQPATFKPSSRRTDYIKAAALLLAEVERLDRAAAEA